MDPKQLLPNYTNDIYFQIIQNHLTGYHRVITRRIIYYLYQIYGVTIPTKLQGDYKVICDTFDTTHLIKTIF